MQLQGEPGTGKSRVIQSITRTFDGKGVATSLQRAAPTGIAACLIDGRTLHKVLGLDLSGNIPTDSKLLELAAFWRLILYLIIDEISMVARDFLAKLEVILELAKERAGVERDGKVFGGVNIIIVGDFHQFPPVMASNRAALYFPIDTAKDSDDEIIGRQLYERFTTVVVLEEQVRVTDPGWQDLLKHARHGRCERRHIEMLEKLVLTSPDCPPTDFENGPWKNAILVTPRNEVRRQWNRAAVQQHCRGQKTPLYLCRAEDWIGKGAGRRGHDEFTEEEKIAYAMRNNRKKSERRTPSLPEEVELAVGMKVLITSNIDTDNDIANGARGEVVEIGLDEGEEMSEGGAVQRLKHLPRYILVKLDRTKALPMEGKERGTVPIEPQETDIYITLPVTGSRRRMVRSQFPLTAGYAFTDYRAQGQTLGNVIVDIGKVPSAKLTPFNAYVALSRSSGRETIRLLRDFDPDLFTKEPCPMLAKEDERLAGLNEETRVMWEARRTKRMNGGMNE